MPSLKFSNTTYRYGFNGKENDPETGTIDFGERMYDSRIAKFLSRDPLMNKFAGSSPYSYAINNPILFIDRFGEAPIKPLSLAAKIWNIFLGDYHVNRAHEFAAKHGIDEANLYSTRVEDKMGGTSSQVIVYQPVLNKETGETIEIKHVFKQHKAGVMFMTDDANDQTYQLWDNYWDDAGNPVLNPSDLSVPLIDGTALLPSGGAAKGVKGIVLLGKTSKTWSVYTFMTSSGRYFGMTTSFVRRMAQHGARIMGAPEDMIKLIPDKLTARGIEQLFINWGREKKIITDQINSINPKNVEKYNEGINKAKEFLQKNYGDAYNYLFEISDDVVKKIKK